MYEIAGVQDKDTGVAPGAAGSRRLSMCSFLKKRLDKSRIHAYPYCAYNATEIESHLAFMESFWLQFLRRGHFEG
jgi:hypothetical protein